MNIDDKLIDYLQSLTRLELTDEEREDTKLGLKKMLGYVSKLSEAPTSDGDKFTFISEMELRPDEIEESLTREDILRNAPRQTGEYFVAGKAVE